MAEEKQMFVEQDAYLKSGIHIGTKFKTKYRSEERSVGKEFRSRWSP